MEIVMHGGDELARTPTKHKCTALSLYQCTALPLYQYVALPLYQCVALPLYKCVALSLYKCVALPLYKCVTLPLYKCVALPLYKCHTLPLYQCHTFLSSSSRTDQVATSRQRVSFVYVIYNFRRTWDPHNVLILLTSSVPKKTEVTETAVRTC
jgi:hypothetical protein